MRTIHKYKLHTTRHEYDMPRNADILCVQVQHGVPCMWALVDDEAEYEGRVIEVLGTGWEMSADMGRSEYVGTYQTDGGLVWHVFASKPNAVSGAV
jgi:hypothetical protein